MTHRLQLTEAVESAKGVDCAADPTASLTEMFVNIVQSLRIDSMKGAVYPIADFEP